MQFSKQIVLLHPEIEYIHVRHVRSSGERWLIKFQFIRYVVALWERLAYISRAFRVIHW